MKTRSSPPPSCPAAQRHQPEGVAPTIPRTMKAAVLHAAHDLRVDEVPVPALGPEDVLVRVRACGICASDVHYLVHGGSAGTWWSHP